MSVVIGNLDAAVSRSKFTVSGNCKTTVVGFGRHRIVLYRSKTMILFGS
jgi:hypothetical protein